MSQFSSVPFPEAMTALAMRLSLLLQDNPHFAEYLQAALEGDVFDKAHEVKPKQTKKEKKLRKLLQTPMPKAHKRHGVAKS